MANSPSDLIFEALCLRYWATTNVSTTMTRRELQEATGLAPEVLMDALQVLCGPQYDHDLACGSWMATPKRSRAGMAAAACPTRRRSCCSFRLASLFAIRSSGTRAGK